MTKKELEKRSTDGFFCYAFKFEHCLCHNRLCEISSGIMVKIIAFGPMGYRPCLITMTSEIGHLFCLKLHMTEIMLRKHCDVSMIHQKLWIKKKDHMKWCHSVFSLKKSFANVHFAYIEFLWARPLYFQSFTDLVHRPLVVDLTVEEGQRLKVMYGSNRGFHAIDVDTTTCFDLYIPVNVS